MEESDRQRTANQGASGPLDALGHCVVQVGLEHDPDPDGHPESVGPQRGAVTGDLGHHRRHAEGGRQPYPVVGGYSPIDGGCPALESQMLGGEWRGQHSDGDGEDAPDPHRDSGQCGRRDLRAITMAMPRRPASLRVVDDRARL